MKEQLANMTIIELVRTGHSFATSIQHSETHSAIVREMASRLEALNLAHIGGMEKLRSANNEVGNLRAVLSIIASSKPVDGEEVVCDFDTLVSLASSALDNSHQAEAWQRKQLTQAHKEGAYFVANRMLAAWEAGFIEDTPKNAADIARMILTSTEFMADAPEGDFDRSFADGVLEDIAAQLHKGEAS